MSSRAFNLAALLLLCASTSFAAPAPLPRDQGTAEVVFDARTEERVRLVGVYFRSQHFLGQFEAESAPRVSISSDGTLVRLQLSGRRDSLAILRKVAGQLSDPFPDLPEGPEKEAQRRVVAAFREEYARRLAAVRRIQMKMMAISDDDIRAAEEAVARYEFEAKPLKIASSPRSVWRGR